MATIQSSAHPDHLLAEHHEDTDYLCSACMTSGHGERYRCTTKSCHLDLHMYCATCPMELSSFMHPEHSLNFGVHNHPVPCDVCGESVDSFYYRCQDCNFNVHPVCTQLPENIPHAAHLEHQLTLQKASPGACIACAEECPSWRYRCGLGGACTIDIHIDCVLEQYLSPNMHPALPPPQTRDLANQKPSPSQFPPQPPLYSGYGHDKARALPEQPPPHNYYNIPPPYHNNHGHPNHFPVQAPIPSGYVHDKASAPPPPPRPNHYYQNQPHPPPYYSYHGYHQPHYPPGPPPPYYGYPGYHQHNYLPPPIQYNHSHPFVQPPPYNGFPSQTPQPTPCFQGDYTYGVPSSSNGHKMDHIVKPGKEDCPKKRKNGKMMWAIVGRLTVGLISGVLFGSPSLSF